MGENRRAGRQEGLREGLRELGRSVVGSPEAGASESERVAQLPCATPRSCRLANDTALALAPSLASAHGTLRLLHLGNNRIGAVGAFALLDAAVRKRAARRVARARACAMRTAVRAARARARDAYAAPPV
eukprot:4362003-Prymnesium_polylepis.1